jgi:hypothetical protein
LSKALGADFRFKETSELVSIEKKADLIIWKNSKHTAWVEVIRVFEKDAKNPNPILFTFSEHDKQELTKLLPGWYIQLYG